VTLGTSGNVDTNTIKAPVFAIVMGEKGLMYSATLEGSKISPIAR
jgi:lipid-binding SYLF domain-containing protein